MDIAVRTEFDFDSSFAAFAIRLSSGVSTDSSLIVEVGSSGNNKEVLEKVGLAAGGPCSCDRRCKRIVDAIVQLNCAPAGPRPAQTGASYVPAGRI